MESGKDWETLSLEPGKADPPVFQSDNDFQNVIDRNKEILRSALQVHEPHMQELLEEMTDRMRETWRAAKEDQKTLLNEAKRQTFGSTELSTKLVDVVCSFESRWIPHEHCACPICWEGGTQQRFSGMPDFVNHMKNTHHIGWKNVKDYWCMIFTKALGKLVYRKSYSGPPAHLDEEMGNAYAWCPYPKCKHTQDKGASFCRHFEKEHKHKSVPAMGIWALMIDLLEQNIDVTVG
jgi:hypothetical protein